MSLTRRALLGAGAGAIVFPGRLFADPGAQLIQHAARPPNYESPRSTFTTRITPVDRFYVRNHFDTPQVEAGAWRLKIGGLVEQPLELSLEELSRMPQVTVEAVLQCAGNGRALFRPRMPGVQWKRGAMGNAEWTGVRLSDLLARAKPKKATKHLSLSGMDRPLLKAPQFIRGIPIAKALHKDTIVALRMNGAPLAAHHGFPARLVVPGWVADDWVKWLSVIELSEAEPTGFFYEVGYRFPVKPGKPGEAVPPEKTRPMTELAVKSVIGSHDDGQVIGPGEQKIAGVAFSGGAGIRKVEVSVDGGRRWAKAELAKSDSPYGFSLFEYAWKAKPGQYIIMSRATDGRGRAQPKTPVWNPSGYLYNAIDPIAVEVRG